MFLVCVPLFVRSCIFYKSHLWEWESDGLVFSVLVYISWALLSKLRSPHLVHRQFLHLSCCQASLQGRCKPGFTILGEDRNLFREGSAAAPAGSYPVPFLARKTPNKSLILKLFYLHWYAQKSITLSSLLKVSISFFALSLCTACLVVTFKLL